MDKNLLIEFIEYNESVLAGHREYMAGLSSREDIEFLENQISNVEKIIEFAKSKLQEITNG